MKNTSNLKILRSSIYGSKIDQLIFDELVQTCEGTDCYIYVGETMIPLEWAKSKEKFPVKEQYDEVVMAAHILVILKKAA